MHLAGLAVGLELRPVRLVEGEKLAPLVVNGQEVVRQPSTLAIAGFNPETKDTRYVFYTEGTAGVGLQEAELPPQLPADVRAVHVGSFALTMETIASALEALVRREAQERVISIDPNIRSMLMHDPDAARERLRRLLPLADVVKLSNEDLEWLEPGA